MTRRSSAQDRAEAFRTAVDAETEELRVALADAARIPVADVPAYLDARRAALEAMEGMFDDVGDVMGEPSC